MELGGLDYSVNSYLGFPNEKQAKQAVALAIQQRPGTNAIATAHAVRDTMEELSKDFPKGLEYRVIYDPTVFVEESVRAVVHTIFEAVLLVVLVVMIFLQSWRATLIPLVAIPVSLIGTFAAMAALGFSLNNLSLFGLVLAIGIVVDDAIVVVENIERNIEEGLSPCDAARKAMDEVGGPVVSVALVLAAVFIPTAFIGGISGQFYRQFALTIAVSTLISAFVSLTLSPALGGILLQPRGAKKDWFGRLFDKVFGWLFRGFNAVFAKTVGVYVPTVARLIRRTGLALIVYALLLVVTFFAFKRVPDRIYSRARPGLCNHRGATSRWRVARTDRSGDQADHPDRASNSRDQSGGRVCRIFRCDAREQLQRRRAFPRLRALRRARQQTRRTDRDRRFAQATLGHSRRASRGHSAAAGARTRDGRRIQNGSAGSLRRRPARAAGRD